MTTGDSDRKSQADGRPRDSLAALAAKYDLKVPRYTSYPTAPHFTGAVDETTYRRWLESLPMGSSMSLYFHVPFCDSMCWFCGCYTKIVRQNQPVAQYLDLLCREVELVAETLPARFEVRHIHWGGGSPTILKPEQWRRTIAHVRDCFAMDHFEELAVELDPRDVTGEYVTALADAGVNRVSIGVQDFDHTVQAAVNRVQPFETVAKVCDWLRESGITHINFDLMYGLPFQSVAGVGRLAEQAVRLQPSRIALFGYAHVPWMKSHQKQIPEHALPDARTRLEQFESVAQVLTSSGYQAVGLDHFARADDDLARALTSGRLRRNFQGYTIDNATALIGFGASAIGQLPQGYVQNASPLKAYGDAIASGRLPTTRGIALSREDVVRRAIIEQLMCQLRVDVAAVCHQHHIPAAGFDGAMNTLSRLANDGLVTIDGYRIEIPPDKRTFVRLVAVAFDAYYQGGQNRHSRAV